MICPQKFASSGWRCRHEMAAWLYKSMNQLSKAEGKDGRKMTFYAGHEGCGGTGRDEVDAVMREWEARYCSYTVPSIFITTFNVNGRPAPTESIPKWLAVDGPPPDFYAIGLQEMDLSPQAFLMNASSRHLEWHNTIQQSFPSSSRYRLVQDVRLVGMFLTIYQRANSLIQIREKETDVQVLPTGFPLLGRMGNKGGVAISLRLNDSCICFVNSHMAAGSEELEKRNQDYREISQIRFPKTGKTLFDHDAIFWFGDMNYRLDTRNGLSNEDIRRICASEDKFRDMIAYDQLKEQKRKNEIFVEFNEPDVLNFQPTYKYDTGTTRWDSSEKCRCPAWCDRILWWCKEGVRINQQLYDSVPSVLLSDHKPVRSLFHVSIRSIDPSKYSVCYEEAVREADRRANEALPQIALSQNEVDFGDVHFFQSASRTLTVKNTGKVRTSFVFGARASRASLCDSWLSVTPPSRENLPPGASCTISLQVLVDKNTAWILYGDTQLSEILVLRLHHGRHYFVTVSALYRQSVFGSSFVEVIRKEAHLASSGSLTDLSVTPTTLTSAHLVGIPEAVYRLGESLKANGLEKIKFDDGSAHSEFLALRNALDSGTPQNLFEVSKSAFCMYDTLLTLISAFREPIVPYNRQTECMNAAGIASRCWGCIESFPPENRCMFIYLTSFISELVERNANALAQMQLLADLTFKQPTGGTGCVQRLKFLETVVSYSRDSCSLSTVSGSLDDRDLIIL